jgi:hypothetical protein
MEYTTSCDRLIAELSDRSLAITCGYAFLNSTHLPIGIAPRHERANPPSQPEAAAKAG